MFQRWRSARNLRYSSKEDLTNNAPKSEMKEIHTSDSDSDSDEDDIQFEDPIEEQGALLLFKDD